MGAVRNANAIGVFDSGVGGLSVLRHIRVQLPRLPLLYVADSAHVPYGDKTADYIRERSCELTEFLLAQGAAMIVIACNTATAAAAATLRERFAMPIVAMGPAVKPAGTAERQPEALRSRSCCRLLRRRRFRREQRRARSLPACRLGTKQTHRRSGSHG